MLRKHNSLKAGKQEPHLLPEKRQQEKIIIDPNTVIIGSG